MRDEKTEGEPYVAPEIARRLEETQIGRYHTKGGTGFAAEDANEFADRLRLRRVIVTGRSNGLNGPDRIVDGVQIQTKYYPSASATIEHAFDPESGQFRYQGQALEVPRCQWKECVSIMRKKIIQEKVPGITNPKEATRIVKRGAVTYKQARNIARAGNLDSLVFDAKTQCVTMTGVLSMSFVFHFAKRRCAGEGAEDAIKGAMISALEAGMTTFATGVLAAQVLRTRAAAIGAVAARNGIRTLSRSTPGRQAIGRLAEASLGKAVHGGAAVNHVAKLVRSNVVTSIATSVVTSTPDLCRAGLSKSMSWAQFTKNLIINAGGVAAGAGGWMGGAAAGAALGSVAPIVGTAIGGVAGAIIGAQGGAWLGRVTAKKAMNSLIEDDTKQMIAILETALEVLAIDFLLSDLECEELANVVSGTVDLRWLRRMYQAGSCGGSDIDRKLFAYEAFEEICLDIVRKRPRVALPSPEMVQAEIHKFGIEDQEE